MCSSASSSTSRLNQPEARVRAAPPDGLGYTLAGERQRCQREVNEWCERAAFWNIFLWKTSQRKVCGGAWGWGYTGLRSVGGKHHAKGCAGQQTGVVSTLKSLLHITRDRHLLCFKCSLPPGSMKISFTFSGSWVLSKIVHFCRFWKFPWKSLAAFLWLTVSTGQVQLVCLGPSPAVVQLPQFTQASVNKQRNKQKIPYKQWPNTSNSSGGWKVKDPHM